MLDIGVVSRAQEEFGHATLARLYPFQIKERATKGPIFGMAALFCRWFEVADRRKCPRRAAGVSRVKSLLHNVDGPAEALPPTAIGFGKMDKVELSSTLSIPNQRKGHKRPYFWDGRTFLPVVRSSGQAQMSKASSRRFTC